MTKKCAIEPVEDYIVLKRESSEEKTPGGIVLPHNAQEKSQKGTIVALGPGRLLENGNRAKMDIKEGDLVLFSKYAGIEIEIEREKFLVVRQGDVIARLR